MPPDPVSSGIDSIVESVLGLVCKRVPADQAAAVASFVRPYYAGTAWEDLEDRDAVDLYGAALSHFNFAYQRRPGQPKVRVYNPQLQRHGWQSTHTIVELVTDDMPFLVDSVRMALNRRSLTTHLVIHPVMRMHRDSAGTLLAGTGGERGEVTRESRFPCPIPGCEHVFRGSRSGWDAHVAPRDRHPDWCPGVDDPDERKRCFQDEYPDWFDDPVLRPIGEPGYGEEGCIIEAVIHVEVDRQTEEQRLDDIAGDLRRVLADVRAAVEDWPLMRERLRTVLAEIASRPLPLDEAELGQGRAFLEWVGDDHFTFLGYREYELFGKEGEERLRSVAGSGLGLLRRAESKESLTFASLSPEIRRLAREPHLLLITKANARSTVHRPGYLDYIGVKRFDAGGRVIGEWRFLGLYTSAAYNQVPRAIPLLREKVARVMERATYPENSHAAKALLHILETFPRDLLFQISDDELFETGMGILHLQERQRVRLFVHRDRIGRFASCIVHVPRERFNTQVRLKIQGLLAEALGARDVEFTVQLSESVLARLYFVFRVAPTDPVEVDAHELEARLRVYIRDWRDALYDELLDHCGEELGTARFRRYGEAFPAGYQTHCDARVAVHDIDSMEAIEEVQDAIAMTLHRPLEAAHDVLYFKLFRPGRPISLSDALPVLENMGLRVETEQPARIERADGSPVWMHDFGMRIDQSLELDIDRIREKFQETFERVWQGDAENDGFNRLVLRAWLDWREIAMLRAYCKYLRQIGTTFSQAYMEAALAGNALIARMLTRLFHVRFDPATPGDRGACERRLVEEIDTALDAVANLDEDRILRSFLGLVLATLRTNFYQRDAVGGVKPCIAFKLDPKKVAEMPEPRPMYEIFVYSPRVEGVHLRGGAVARGGVRWSDRREDFRTEVLGLVKAQMVKNSVIVPVGSKGGFVPKRLPAGGSRDAIQAEGVACYEIFVSSLLDLGDNLAGGRVVPPDDVVRYDGDDPYLVVAADKGTATFSDLANRIAKGYGFWLGDAFASGGSQGYDHKGMAITARGAWESIKRHFRELGSDVQSTDFTVIGIGDMSGDVFGNGMLMSRHTRLLGAFNHLHIFIDPDPDPAASYRERARLFALPRSSWSDYDPALLSHGGGVYARSAKSIALSPEARAALGIESPALTPNELIRALLRAPVDLLWNGGIGTYVKASHERDVEVGDRSNDAVRVDGAELRCKVIGEGGNLGCTQLGRVEFAARGGRVTSDAIDNSGGVDCSDHEVNIKILLNEVVAAGDMTEKQRNALLADMTDEVAVLVLRNNYLQTQAISLAAAQAHSLLEVHVRLIRALERSGDLDPEIECLPDAEALEERASRGRGLHAPELSVLMAYVKITSFKALLGSGLGSDRFIERELERYFPGPLRERFPERIRRHRLAREIIATVVANEVVNRAGITFLYRLAEETGAEAADIARAYLVAREVFDMEWVWTQIESLDNEAGAPAQIAMLLESRKLVERATRWLLRHCPRPIDVGGAVERFAPGVAALSDNLINLVAPASRDAMRRRADELAAQGVPRALAERVAEFTEVFSSFDIIAVARSTAIPVGTVAAVYFALGAELELHWLRDQVFDLPRENRWQALARTALRDELYSLESALTRKVLEASASSLEPEERIGAWIREVAIAVSRWRQVLADLKAAGSIDFAMLSVAMGEIRALERSRASGTGDVGEPAPSYSTAAA